MSYKAAYACKECKGILTYNQAMYSEGVCPLCGFAVNGPIVPAWKVAIDVKEDKYVGIPIFICVIVVFVVFIGGILLAGG